MRITERLQKPSPSFSFEFFPPRTEPGLVNLLETLRDLKELEPSFVSMTYGAGGSTQRSTTELTAQIKHEIGIGAMAHLTCVGHSQAQMAQTLDELAAAGIDVATDPAPAPPPIPSIASASPPSPVATTLLTPGSWCSLSAQIASAGRSASAAPVIPRVTSSVHRVKPTCGTCPKKSKPAPSF